MDRQLWLYFVMFVASTLALILVVDALQLPRIASTAVMVVTVVALSAFMKRRLDS